MYIHIYKLYRPALVLIYAFGGKRLKSFLVASVSETHALMGTEQKDGGYDTDKLRGEERVCQTLSSALPRHAFSLSFRLSPSLFPPVLLFSVTGKAFPPEQGSLEPQGTPPLAVSPCTWIPQEWETGERKTRKTEGEVHLHHAVCALLLQQTQIKRRQTFHMHKHLSSIWKGAIIVIIRSIKWNLDQV